MQRSPSNLFDRFNNRAAPPLVHPTAKAFDVHEFIEQTEQASLSVADAELKIAAIFVGNQLKSLRSQRFPKLLQQLNRVNAIRLSVAAVNRSIALSLQTLLKANRKGTENEDAGHLSAIESITIKSIQGDVTFDEIAMAAIDSLPHWFAQAIERPEKLDSSGKEYRPQYRRIHAEAESCITIERALRDIWQQILWEPWVLDPKQFTISPKNRDDAAKWKAWQHRQDTLSQQQNQFDLLAGISHEDAEPVINEAVQSAALKNGRYRLSYARPRKRQRAHHSALVEIAEHSYLGPFLDIDIPGKGFTARTLVKAWLALDSLAKALVNSATQLELNNRFDLKRLAFEISENSALETITTCLGVDSAQAEKILKCFVCDPMDLKDSFSKGLWHRPLVKHPSAPAYMVLTGVLQSANFVYVLELLFKDTGLAKSMDNRSLGHSFEDDLRKRLAHAVSNNSTLADAKVAPNSIPKKKESDEEIDVIIRCQELVIVGEIKCLVRPVDSVDRYNYLNKLESAAEQAVRKRDWLKVRPQVLKTALAEPNLNTENLRYAPLVILNNGSGIGLKFGDALVTDAHWLKLILGDRRFASGAMKNFNTGEFIPKFTDLYSTSAEFARQFEHLITDPPGLNKFTSSIVWQTLDFPTSSGNPLTLHRPYLSNELMVQREMNS